MIAGGAEASFATRWALPPAPCAGCDELVAEVDAGTVWIAGALGMVGVKTHREQECARLAVERHPEQPAWRIPEPLSREERMKREADSC